MLVLFELNPGVVYGAVFLFGLIIGSFLNVVIIRLPKKLSHEWESQSRDVLGLEPGNDTAPPGLVLARSACPHCAHTISAVENIPLLSYLILKGKCRHCRKPIAMRYPLVEMLTAILSVIVIWVFGPTVQGLWALVFTWALIAASGIDVDHQILPDNITLPLMWLGMILSVWNINTDTVSSILGAAGGYLFLWFIYHVFRLLTGKEGMGYGDFKLLAALGAWLGWQQLPLVILLSSVVGVIAGVALARIKRNSPGTPIPFGPYLAIAGWIALLWGQDIISRYLHIAGIQG